MATTIAAEITPRGLLIPNGAIQEWIGRGVEVIKEQQRIIIQPKPAPLAERERVIKCLEDAGLLLPLEPSPSPRQELSAQERAELGRKFSVGRPLSEIIIEEREDRP